MGKRKSTVKAERGARQAKASDVKLAPKDATPILVPSSPLPSLSQPTATTASAPSPVAPVVSFQDFMALAEKGPPTFLVILSSL
jgi:hypothetical protein